MKSETDSKCFTDMTSNMPTDNDPSNLMLPNLKYQSYVGYLLNDPTVDPVLDLTKYLTSDLAFVAQTHGHTVRLLLFY